MGFWKNLFTPKKIIRTEIIGQTDGLDESNKLANLVVGHREGGFDGMVTADVYNQYHSAKTTFKVYYDNGSYTTETVYNDSSRYNYLLQFLA